MKYDDFLSHRVKRIKPSGIRKFFDAAAMTSGVISLGVGEPDFVTPWHVRNAAVKALTNGRTSYTGNSGLPELRQAVCKYLAGGFGLNYDYASQVIITVGGSEGIDITLRAILNAGDEVLTPEPSYVAYAPLIELAGGVAVPVKCTAKEQFKLTAQAVEQCITPRTKALIFAYPNNPTGAVMTGKELEPLAKVIKKHNLLALSDEIYAELTYGFKHTSIASLPGMAQRTILISGFSKAFAMTGWRLGYICAPKELAAAMLKIHQYAMLCAPTLSQYAALEALKSGLEYGFLDIEEMRAEYDKRRKFIVKCLNEMGLLCFEPKGAFYAFPNVLKKTGMDGETFAGLLLKRQKVAVVPGSAFGESCKGHVRISYAQSMQKLEEAMLRISKTMQ